MTLFSLIRPPVRVACAVFALQAAWLPLAQADDVLTPASLSTARYPGTVELDVDATDVQQRVFRVRELLPVKPGKLLLAYPRWLPGNHAPTGPIGQLAGLQITAGGQPLAWTRDAVDVNLFHVDVPRGTDQLALSFEFLSPQQNSSGRVVLTTAMTGVQWNTVVLYPATANAAAVTVRPRLKLPAGWQFGSALEVATDDGAEGAHQVVFQPTSLERLVDSPLFAGRNFKRVDLDPEAVAQGRPTTHLNIVADQPQQLDAKPEQLAAHVALVQQAFRLYGAQHYKHYDFLLALSSEFGGIGLEHHESSENGVQPEYFTEWDKGAPGRDLLPHEYTHSWNGKFRRPADLTTPNFNVPMRNSLLWVYEGQTQYWGKVLSARSGLHSPEDARAGIAELAAYLEVRAGRAWRNLQDTTEDALIGYRTGKDWPSWQRGADYYDEAVLVWLDADTKIRELSAGQRSLDDFARAFFGVDNGQIGPKTYTFDEVVRTLNGVQAFDWAPFLRARLDRHDGATLFDGLRRAGWKLVYTDKPTAYEKAADGRRKRASFLHSVGLVVGREDKIGEVLWDSPAFKAGVAPGATLLAVNGRAYAAEVLREAISAAKAADHGASTTGNGQPSGKSDQSAASGPIELLLKSGDQYRTVPVDWHGGLRYPTLERIDGTDDRLTAILTARPAVP